MASRKKKETPPPDNVPAETTITPDTSFKFPIRMFIGFAFCAFILGWKGSEFFGLSASINSDVTLIKAENKKIIAEQEAHRQFMIRHCKMVLMLYKLQVPQKLQEEHDCNLKEVKNEETTPQPVNFFSHIFSMPGL